MANIMTEQDKNKLAYNSQEWAKANQAGNTILADSLHSDSEAIRAKYGYSGGADGSQMIALGGSQGANDYTQYINDAHAAQQQNAIAGLESAYQRSIADLDRAEGKIAPQYQAARNQTAATNEQEKRAFAEYAAARGLNSGTGGQAELARGVTLQGNMNALNQSESEAVADIATQRAKLASEYQMAITQARAQGDLARAEALYQEYVRQDEAKRATEQFAEQMNLAWAEYNAGRADNTWNQNRTETRDAVSDRQAEYNANLAMAQFLAQSGDFSGLRDMGIDTTQLESVWQVDRNLAVQLAQKQLVTAASGGTTDEWDGLSFNEMMTAINSSLVTPAVKAAYLHWMGVPYPGEDAQESGGGTGGGGGGISPAAQSWFFPTPLRGLGGVEEDIAKRLKSGQITPEEAEGLGRQFGIIK